MNVFQKLQEGDTVVVKYGCDYTIAKVIMVDDSWIKVSGFARRFHRSDGRVEGFQSTTPETRILPANDYNLSLVTACCLKDVCCDVLKKDLEDLVDTRSLNELKLALEKLRRLV